MKYCVSARQPKSVLREADEIKFLYEDRERIIDYIEEFPDKTFILIIPKEIKSNDINWDICKAYAEKVNLIFAIEDLYLSSHCKVHNISFYWNYPIITWYELDAVISLNPCYIFINDSLIFSLNKIQEKTNIPVRACPNVCYNDYIPRKTGLYGTWIRPEDVESTYAKYVSVFEFDLTELSEEATLLKVYKSGEWPGNLNILLKNFNVNVENRALPEEMGETRANCGRRCMEGSNCHFCETAILFANSIRKKHYKDKKINPIEEN